jgi:hypothetical protein
LKHSARKEDEMANIRATVERLRDRWADRKQRRMRKQRLEPDANKQTAAESRMPPSGGPGMGGMGGGSG